MLILATLAAGGFVTLTGTVAGTIAGAWAASRVARTKDFKKEVSETVLEAIAVKVQAAETEVKESASKINQAQLGLAGKLAKQEQEFQDRLKGLEQDAQVKADALGKRVGDRVEELRQESEKYRFDLATQVSSRVALLELAVEQRQEARETEISQRLGVWEAEASTKLNEVLQYTDVTVKSMEAKVDVLDTAIGKSLATLEEQTHKAQDLQTQAQEAMTAVSNLTAAHVTLQEQMAQLLKAVEEAKPAPRTPRKRRSKTAAADTEPAVAAVAPVAAGLNGTAVA
jgi:hypothetical protein